MTEKETVIVVHGTFSGRPDGTRRRDINADSQMWFEPDKRGSFCDKLDAALKAKQADTGNNDANTYTNAEYEVQGLPKCWRHLENNTDHFFWDGANHWLSRYRASTRLRKHLKQLIKSGYTVHLVGHSHGGNVILDAITDNHTNVHDWFNGQVALLGTPIYINKPQKIISRVFSLFSTFLFAVMIWAAIFIISGVKIDFLSAFDENQSTQNIAAFIAVGTFFLTIIALVNGVRPFINRLSSIDEKKPMKRTPQIMLVNSEADEAYRILCDLDGAQNPLIQEADSHDTIKKSQQLQTGQLTKAISFLFSNTVESFSFLGPSIKKKLGIQDVKLIIMITFGCLMVLTCWTLINIFPQWLGLTTTNRSLLNLCIACVLLILFMFNLKLMLSVLIMPGLILLGFVKSVFSTIKTIVFFIFEHWIKSRVWSFLLNFALGINGGPRRLNQITVSRKFDAGPGQLMDVFYFELPEYEVSRIKSEQKQFWSTLYSDVFDKTVVWTPLMLKKALTQEKSNAEEATKNEVPMIHTHYYHNPECIDLIAQWLVEPRLFEQNFSRQVDVTPGTPGVGLKEKVSLPNQYELHVDRMRLRYKKDYANWIDSSFDPSWNYLRQRNALEQFGDIEPIIPKRHQKLHSQAKMEYADSYFPKSPHTMISPSLRKPGPPPKKPKT